MAPGGGGGAARPPRGTRARAGVPPAPPPPPEGVLRAARRLAEALWGEALRAERFGGDAEGGVARLVALLEGSLRSEAGPLLLEVARERVSLGGRGADDEGRLSSATFQLGRGGAGAKALASGLRTRGDKAGAKGVGISPPRRRDGGRGPAGGRPGSAPVYRSPYAASEGNAREPSRGVGAASPSHSRPLSGRPAQMARRESDADAKMRRSIRAAYRDLDWLKEVGQRRRQNHQIHQAAMRFIRGGGRPDGKSGGTDSGGVSAEETFAEANARGRGDTGPAPTGDEALSGEALAESSSATLVSLGGQFDRGEGRGGEGSLESPDGLLDEGPDPEKTSFGPHGW